MVNLREERDASLVEVIDRLIDTGVVVVGDARLSVADVDLVYIGLKLVLCTADRIDPFAKEGVPPPPSTAPSGASAPLAKSSAVRAEPSSSPSAAEAKQSMHPTVGSETYEPSPHSSALAVTPDNITSTTGVTPPTNNDGRSLAKLVLCLVELLRQLTERQALRRMERGTVTDEQVERMSVHFEQLSEQLEAMKKLFNLSDSDLNLDLGPLGKLLD